MTFVAIDFETGFNGPGGICEVGLAVVNDGRITETRSWLIQPLHNRINPINARITHITPDMTANAPTFPQVWHEILPYLDGQSLVAHNAKTVEVSLLRKTLDHYTIPFPNCAFYCSLAAAKRFLAKQTSYRLSHLCEQLSITQKCHHRAEDDAIACAELFLKIIERWKIQTYYCGQSAKQWQYEFEQIDLKPNPSDRKTSGKRKIYRNEDPIPKAEFILEQYLPAMQLLDKTICVTGETRYSRQQMQDLITYIGAFPVPTVTRATDILLVGDTAYREFQAAGKASGKMKKAINLNRAKEIVEIMPETEFFNLINPLYHH